MLAEKYPILNRPNFPYTQSCLDAQLNDLPAVLEYFRHLAYQRISNPELPLLVLEESRGTCSSKHAFIKLLAEEQEWLTVKLLLVLYKMDAENTAGIGQVLAKNGLDYLPEAHTVLEVDGIIHDITFPHSDFSELAPAVLEVRPIEGMQVGLWKKQFHQNWLRNWLIQEKLELGFEELWLIREECIAALST